MRNMSHKRKWRKRTHGTARQIGTPFILDESQQSMKARLPKAQYGVRGSRGVLEEKKKYEDARKQALEEEVRRELDEKEHQPKKTTTEKIKTAVKAITPKPKPKSDETLPSGKRELSEMERLRFKIDPSAEFSDHTAKDLPEDLREEIRPVIAEAKSDGRAISDYLKNSRIERFFEKRAIMRRIKKEEKESSR
jgi:hypothetical protein